MKTSYEFKIEKSWYNDDFGYVHSITMFVNGKEVAWRTIDNIHESISERASQLRTEMINKWERSH